MHPQRGNGGSKLWFEVRAGVFLSRREVMNVIGARIRTHNEQEKEGGVSTVICYTRLCIIPRTKTFQDESRKRWVSLGFSKQVQPKEFHSTHSEETAGTSCALGSGRAAFPRVAKC